LLLAVVEVLKFVTVRMISPDELVEKIQLGSLFTYADGFEFAGNSVHALGVVEVYEKPRWAGNVIINWV
jgi:hypothetical protein